MANDLNIGDVPFGEKYEQNEWPQDFPLIRDASKCIKCMRCVQICDKVQELKIWDVINTGKRTSVGVSGRKQITESDCAVCGQCITHCPVGALHERDDIDKLMDAVHDPEKIVVVQIAPAVRSAWGEGIGLSREMATEKRMAAAVRALGVDYVFDTNFSADLTIMEEGNEFLERMTHADEYSWPMFTSCCPGWVRFVNPVSGYGEEFVNGKISAADVRCSGKILLRTDIGCGSFQNFQCFHYALCGKET